MALTIKQEHFCRLIADGMTFTDAYLTAYDWKGSTAGASVEATKLVAREDIQEKITSLIRPKEIAIARDAVNAREERIQFILSRIEHCTQNDDEQSLIRWNEQLNKIYGLYKDTETEEKRESSISGLSTEALQRVLKSS